MSPVRPDVLAVRSKIEQLTVRAMQAGRANSLGLCTEPYRVVAEDVNGIPVKLIGTFFHGIAVVTMDSVEIEKKEKAK